MEDKRLKDLRVQWTEAKSRAEQLRIEAEAHRINNESRVCTSCRKATPRTGCFTCENCSVKVVSKKTFDLKHTKTRFREMEKEWREKNSIGTQKSMLPEVKDEIIKSENDEASEYDIVAALM